jgi:resuscitation-promoting factor RpfB
MYYGGLQFLPSTWRSVGGSGMPHHASKAEQIKRGKILQQRSGWGQWPACSRKLGLR